MTTIMKRMTGYSTTPVRGSETFNRDMQTRMDEMAANAADTNMIADQMNILAGEIEANAAATAADVVAAADQVALAAQQVALAAEQVALAEDAKSAAENGATAAEYDPGKVGGYLAGECVYDPATGLTYRCLVEQAEGAVQALTETAFWVRLNGPRTPEEIGLAGLLDHGNEHHNVDFLVSTNYASNHTGGTVKCRLNGTTAYFTTNGNNA